MPGLPPLDVAGTAVLVGVLGIALLFWLRGRRLGGVRLTRFDLARGFPRTRSRGYAVADVDEVLDLAYGLAAEADGRPGALELLHAAQFAPARGGYDAEVVDLHVDAMVVALQTGRELPRRPGTPRPGRAA